MTHKFRLLIVILALVAPVTANTEVWLNTRGVLDVHVLEVECPDNPSVCRACAHGDEVGSGTECYVGLGQAFNGAYTQGLAEATVYPYARLSGLHVPPSLLPVGTRVVVGTSTARSGFAVNCPDGGIGSNATIDEFGITMSTTGDHFFVLPPRESYLVTIEVCSVYTFVGAGCNHAGSSIYRWQIAVPETPSAHDVAAGDAPPIAPAGARVAVDFSSGPGGLLTITRLPQSPLARYGFEPVDQWDIRGEMTDGSFDVELAFSFNLDELPMGFDPETLVIASLDVDTGAQTPLSTTIDVDALTANVRVSELGVFLLAPTPAVPVEETSWGSLKRMFSR